MVGMNPPTPQDVVFRSKMAKLAKERWRDEIRRIIREELERAKSPYERGEPGLPPK